MESKRNPARHQAADAAWSISAGTRKSAQAADTGMAADDFLYAPPSPPPQAAPQLIALPILSQILSR
jgi:hypothetical protein